MLLGGEHCARCRNVLLIYKYERLPSLRLSHKLFHCLIRKAGNKPSLWMLPWISSEQNTGLEVRNSQVVFLCVLPLTWLAWPGARSWRWVQTGHFVAESIYLMFNQTFNFLSCPLSDELLWGLWQSLQTLYASVSWFENNVSVISHINTLRSNLLFSSCVNIYLPKLCYLGIKNYASEVIWGIWEACLTEMWPWLPLAAQRVAIQLGWRRVSFLGYQAVVARKSWVFDHDDQLLGPGGSVRAEFIEGWDWFFAAVLFRMKILASDLISIINQFLYCVLALTIFLFEFSLFLNCSRLPFC